MARSSSQRTGPRCIDVRWQTTTEGRRLTGWHDEPLASKVGRPGGLTKNERLHVDAKANVGDQLRHLEVVLRGGGGDDDGHAYWNESI
jgi:hypothetical protein